MGLDAYEVLIVPGLDNSGPEHWQTIWQSQLPAARRVEQADWSHPKRGPWTESLVDAIARATRPVVLVAHSLGVHVVAHAVAHSRPVVKGAFLVCPPDVERADITPIAPDFAPILRAPLGFPSVVVASRDDPYSSFERVAAMARGWASDVVDVGDAGHVNVARGFGPWPEGLAHLGAFVARL